MNSFKIDLATCFLPRPSHTNISIAITKDGTKLMAQSPGQPELELFAESQTKFFVKEAAIQIEFVVDGSGKATSLVLH
jgi:D-alanyl-D-alanine-carboxypeptidase/D-alanyl-D-alanine-endopeptidase